jgi:hypothetical protein
MSEDVRQLNHIVGSTRTIQTAVLVVEYLSGRTSALHRDRFSYRFKDPTEQNGWWSADILVTTYGDESLKFDAEISKLVELCRAFVAGRGEVWA